VRLKILEMGMTYLNKRGGEELEQKRETICFANNNILVTVDEEGKKLVVIPQIIFKGKKKYFMGTSRKLFDTLCGKDI